jgi:serine/threonine-protein kinase
MLEPGAGFEAAAMAGASDEEAPVYGVGVPYGGNDRTEEVEPIALDMPFRDPPSSSEGVLTPPLVTPAAPTQPRLTLRPAPGGELKAPVAELVLSDLFDSTPPPPGSALNPPDPVAFSTSRPPPKGFSGLRLGKPARDAEKEKGKQAASPWEVSRQKEDAQYFATGSAQRPSAVPRPAQSAAPAVSRAPTPSRPYPAGAPTRAGFPGEPEATKQQAPVSRASEPVASGGVVALPSIDVLASPAFPRPDSVFPRAEPRPRAPAFADETTVEVEPEPPSALEAPVTAEPVTSSEPLAAVSPESAPERAERVAAEPEPALAAEPAPPEPTPPAAPSEASPSSAPAGRRSVPTLESAGNSTARAKRSSSRPKARERQAEEVARFPSDVPTSRPPDVMLTSESLLDSEQPVAPKSRLGSRPGSSAPPGQRRSSNPPAQSALAMPPSTKTVQLALPLVMLGQDVEVEPDSTAQRRAQRAARETVRLELPAGFGRPGSPLLRGLGQGTSTALPLPEPDIHFRGQALKRFMPWAFLAIALLGLCLALVLRPRAGSLVVTALGSGHRAVDKVQIFVDGAPLCDSSPCRISGLSAGNHQLRASAPGLSSGADQTVEINSGEESAANIELSPVEKPAPSEAANDAPKPAKREKVVVTIRLSPDSEGASVNFDDAFLLDFPAELELDQHTTHTLSASKAGYEDLALHLDLGDEKEKQIEVALTPLEGAHRPRPRPAASAAAAPSSSAALANPRKPAAAASHPAASAPALDPTQGLLNISSVPPSQIILNGRPLGSTPKTAVVVPGDSLQTIVFVHPKMGRRRAQKFVPAGKERTVSIRF